MTALLNATPVNLFQYWNVVGEYFEYQSYAIILGVIACIIVPYIFGSLNFAIIISRIFFHDDIRKYGSGNAGMTNMLRTYGKPSAAATLLLDMSKGLLAVLFGRLICGSLGGAVAGIFVVLGHMFPCFYKFKGGKGVATTAMVALATNWLVFLLLLAVFLIIVIGTKYVSLGSVIGVALYPIFLHALAPGYIYGYHFNVLAAFVIAAFVIFMHRANIKRIWNGTESKISLKSKKK